MEFTTTVRKNNLVKFIDRINYKIDKLNKKLQKKDSKEKGKISELAKDIVCTDKKLVGKGVQGTIYLCKFEKKDPIKKGVAVKQTVLTKYQKRFLRDIFQPKALKQEPFIELAAVTLINQLVFNNVCPNFILNYYYEIDKKCKRGDVACTIQYNEFIEKGMTFEKWAESRHNTAKWFNAFFQIFAGLYAIERYFDMTHSDLHAKNILVKKVKPGGYWKYTIESYTYYVPNLGYQFLINDFGFSWIANKLEIPWYHKRHLALTSTERKVYDIEKLRYILEYADNRSTKEVYNTFNVVFDYFINEPENFEGVRDILELLYSGTYIGLECQDKKHFCYTNKKFVSGDLIQSYSFNKKLKLKKFPKGLHDILSNMNMIS
jgi:hypothetical protein